MWIADFVYLFYRILCGTWRIEIVEDPKVAEFLSQKAPLILAHWHGDELALLHLVKRYKLATMTSTSKDGGIIDRVIYRLGGSTARGSSTRGGVGGLKGLVRYMRQGQKTSFAVDGPRGPIYQPKPGVFELSKLCNAHIVPVGVAVNRKWVFEKSWNKIYLPKPFTRVGILLGEPIAALNDNAEPKDRAMAQLLTERLNTARQQASKIIATI